MKRSRLLVDYSDSEEEHESESSIIKNAPTRLGTRPPKKYASFSLISMLPLIRTTIRKLPTLSNKLAVAAPEHNPEAHQGRVRSKPHVDGQYAAYVYIIVNPEREAAFSAFVTSVVKHAKVMIPCLHSMYLNGERLGTPEQPVLNEAENSPKLPHGNKELHISLSRPIYLRSYQREDLKRQVKAIAQSHHRYSFRILVLRLFSLFQLQSIVCIVRDI